MYAEEKPKETESGVYLIQWLGNWENWGIANEYGLLRRDENVLQL